MSSLAGEDLVRLATAIGNAFGADELEELVRMTFSQSLYDYVGRGLPDKVLILRLLEALERQGTIVIFLRAVRRVRAHRQDLINLIQKLEERLEDERRRQEAEADAQTRPQNQEANLATTTPRHPVTANDERTFYRRLAQNLTQPDFSVGLLAHYPLNVNDPNNPALRAEINRVESDVKAVCEARLKVSELGDMEILEQVNKVCIAFQIGEDFANHSPAGFSAAIAAQAVVQLGLLKNSVMMWH